MVNERDELGSDLVPDYLTSVKDGAFYGWPWSYWGQHVDERVQAAAPRDGGQGRRARLRAWARTSRRWAWRSPTRGMPPHFASGAFIGEHGSWNRKPHSGYKVVFVPFAGGRPVGPPVDFLTGFLSADGKA